MNKNYIKKVMGVLFPLLTTVLAYYAITTITEEGKGFYLFMGILVSSSWYVGYLLLDQCKHCKWHITLYLDWIFTPIGLIRASSTELILMLPFTAIEFEVKELNTNRFTFKNSLW